jgi:hypothetical protein
MTFGAHARLGCGALCLGLITLKLAGILPWPWWLLFAPLWTPALLVLALIIVFACFTAWLQ